MSLEIFGLTFNLYGLVLGIAILAAFQVSLWLAKTRKIDQKIVEKLFWWVVIGGIIGARIYHVMDQWSEIYRANPRSIFYIWNGGLAIWGAIVGGVIGLVVAIKMMKIEIKRSDLLEVTFFGLPLGQAIGRWGNFFNKEIVGRNGEPLFIYESGLDLLLFLLLVVGRKKWRGKLAGIYLLGYGLIRLLLETFRESGDQWLVGGVSMATALSAGAIGLGLVLVVSKKQSKARVV